jgi:hypothetical protein
MQRLLPLAILIGAFLVLDQVFFQGRYFEVALGEMNREAHVINQTAQNMVAKLNR